MWTAERWRKPCWNDGKYSNDHGRGSCGGWKRTGMDDCPEDRDIRIEGLGMTGQQGERLQKALAQAGVGSRREMEQWIADGRVTVNDKVATLGTRVLDGDVVRVDRRVIRIAARGDSLPRVLLYHKQEGEIVSRDDPEKRASVFDKLPKLRGQKWMAVGRLDFNTSGLLIFTTSGDLANQLMHPRFEVEREYAVRVQGSMTEEQMRQMVRQGLELDDGPVRFEKLSDEGGEGFNHWYRLVLKEGRNRIVRRTFDALGLPVSRLMRVRFGIVGLPPRLKRGMLAELGPGEVGAILDWAGVGKPQAAAAAAPRKTGTAAAGDTGQRRIAASGPNARNSARSGERQAGPGADGRRKNATPARRPKTNGSRGKGES
jgi:23S rRNA pseudouridine2605 synthase